MKKDVCTFLAVHLFVRSAECPQCREFFPSGYSKLRVLRRFLLPHRWQPKAECAAGQGTGSSCAVACCPVNATVTAPEPLQRAPAGAAGSQHPQVPWQLGGHEWHLLVKWCPGIISEQGFHRDTSDISML